MKVKLSDAFDLQMGKTPPRNDRECWGDGHKWISISDIGNVGKYIDTTKEEITDIGVSKSGIKVVPKGTVIMSFKLSIGKTAITAEDMYTNEAIMAFINKEKYEIDTDYLYHMCKGIDWFEGTNKAVLGLTLNKATMSEKIIEIPPMEVQLHVVSVLDKMDELISLRKEQLAKLDQLVKSRFIELFGDPYINDKNWIVDPLGNYMTTLTDFSANGSYELLDSNVIMYDEPNYAVMVRTTDLESGDLSSGVKYIDKSAYELLNKSKLFGGELIMNKIGSAGKIYIMPYINRPASLGRNAFMFRFDDRLNMKYLYFLLSSDYGTNEIQQYVRGAVTKTITKDSTRAIKIIVPPIELQNQFAAFVEQTDKSKLAIQASLDKLELLKKSLMQEYFG